MKKISHIIASLLAISFLAPTFFVACKSPTPEVGIENGESTENTESGNVDVEEILPPAVETPAVPSPPTPPEDPVVSPKPQKAEYLRCTGNSVNLRSGAGSSYAVVGSANKGETYAVVGKSGNWYETYYRGKKVYISASYVSLLSLEKHEDKNVEKVLNEGYKLLGVPYVYGAVRFHDGKGNLLGGFNAQKFDCSSLVQYVFYKGANTLLQVTTRTQVVQGDYVKPNDLQRGDCMYFTNESRKHLSGVNRVGHVAIYLGGNYILHTASDYARIEQISATRWSYFLEARRFT